MHDDMPLNIVHALAKFGANYLNKYVHCTHIMIICKEIAALHSYHNFTIISQFSKRISRQFSRCIYIYFLSNFVTTGIGDKPQKGYNRKGKNNGNVCVCVKMVECERKQDSQIY